MKKALLFAAVIIGTACTASAQKAARAENPPAQTRSVSRKATPVDDVKQAAPTPGVRAAEKPAKTTPANATTAGAPAKDAPAAARPGNDAPKMKTARKAVTPVQ